MVTRGEPLIRYSPIQGEDIEGAPVGRSYYVPFIAPLSDAVSDGTTPGEPTRTMMVGKLDSERKNHIMLLEALNSLEESYDIRLSIIGTLNDDHDDHYRKICRYIKDHNMEGVVDIHVDLDYEDVQELYAEHDLFVLPSRNEVAAISPIEAMGAGLPVICSDSNGTKEYVDVGKNGYIFETGNQSDLEEKIGSLLTHPERMEVFGEKSRTIAERRYSPDVFYEHFSKMLSEVL